MHKLRKTLWEDLNDVWFWVNWIPEAVKRNENRKYYRFTPMTNGPIDAVEVVELGSSLTTRALLSSTKTECCKAEIDGLRDFNNQPNKPIIALGLLREKTSRRLPGKLPTKESLRAAVEEFGLDKFYGPTWPESIRHKALHPIVDWIERHSEEGSEQKVLNCGWSERDYRNQYLRPKRDIYQYLHHKIELDVRFSESAIYYTVQLIDGYSEFSEVAANNISFKTVVK